MMSEHADFEPKSPSLRFRQVHLDFHTSPLIPAVGEEFDADAWARRLREAHIDSITCFATCHHGMSYYPTKVGFMHPHLKRDLLGEQIEAAHRYGINVPVYITVVWSEHQAEEHPEWRQVHRDGTPVGRAPVGPLAKHGWHWLCMNSPYADHVSAVAEEVLSGYAADGLFFDIVMSGEPGCCCAYCLRGMLAEGVNPEDDAALHAYTLAAERRFMDRISRRVWEKRPGLPLFFNARMRLNGDPEEGSRPEAPYYTHWELESLPTGGWGYTHFALYNRFFQTLGKPILGMTAAFHRSWADFGTVKSQAALDYECFRALAGGAACSIGDQLHPRGAQVPETYRRIGKTYASVEAKEPWCRGAVPLADVAILLPADTGAGTRVAGLESEEGALHMLLEMGAQVAVTDRAADFSPYRVIVAPDHVRLAGDLEAKLRGYIAAGGAVLFSHESGLRPDGSGFALQDLMGIEYVGTRTGRRGVLPADRRARRLDPGDGSRAVRSRQRGAGRGRDRGAGGDRLAVLLPDLGTLFFSCADAVRPDQAARPRRRHRPRAGCLPIASAVPLVPGPWLSGLPADRGRFAATAPARAAGAGQPAYHGGGYRAEAARGHRRRLAGAPGLPPAALRATAAYARPRPRGGRAAVARRDGVGAYRLAAARRLPGTRPLGAGRDHVRRLRACDRA